MFGDFFGNDDMVEEIIEEAVILDMLDCGNCRGTCTCGYGRPVQSGFGAPLGQRRLGCGRCYGRCYCDGYDEFGNLLRAELAVELIEKISDDIF